VTSDGAPGVVAIVFRDGKPLYRRQVGDVDPDEAVPVASASKWVAAALVMTVVDEGRLSLDDPIGLYLQDIPEPGRAVTLRQLLSFTSGHGGLAGLADLRQPPDIDLAESARRIAARPLVGPPGTVFSYGSGALQIAGALAERATGKSWATLFDERLAGPLGLARSRWGHPLHPDAREVSNPNLQGGLVTTAEDYGRFLTMIASGGLFEGKRILSEASVEEMERLQTTAARMTMVPGHDGRAAGYGLGNWCERAAASGRCTLVSSPGALGTYPWLDRDNGIYGIFLVRHRFPAVAASLAMARDAAIAQAAEEPAGRR